jgi:hypothetical protein
MTLRLDTYKGFAIEVDQKGKFTAWRFEERDDFEGEKQTHLTEEVADASTLEKLKAKVDELSKQKLGIVVWVHQYEDRFEKGTVTSIKQDDSRYGRKTYSARVAGEGRDWSQQAIESLYKDTPENAQIIDGIAAVMDDIKKLKAKVEEWKKKLERHKHEDFGVKV